MNTQSQSRRTVSEGQLTEETGVDRLQLHLASAAHRLGQYDSVSHVLYFSEEEANQVAAVMGLRRRPRPADAAALKDIPGPGGE